jgi:hypothetical protein
MLKYSKNLKWNDDARHATLNSFFFDQSMDSVEAALIMHPTTIHRLLLFLGFTLCNPI